MQKCTEENIVSYIKYVRCELRRKEERRLDYHIQSCEDCLVSFAYIEEIVTNKQKLVDDEKTLLLRYISDPIWLYEREKLKQEILKLVTQVNNLSSITIGILDNPNTNTVTNDTNQSSDTTITPVFVAKANITATPVSITNTNNTNNITDNTKKTSHSRQRYSLFVAAVLILVFFSLSTGIYLGLNKQQSSLLVTPSATITTPTPNAIANSTNNSTNNSINSNLYAQLDSAIDRYLESKNNDYLKQAENIANKIETKYQDKCGVALTNY